MDNPNRSMQDWVCVGKNLSSVLNVMIFRLRYDIINGKMHTSKLHHKMKVPVVSFLDIFLFYLTTYSLR